MAVFASRRVLDMTILTSVLWSDLHSIPLPTFRTWVANRSFHPFKGTCHVVSAGTAADLCSVLMHQKMHKRGPVALGYLVARFYARPRNQSTTVANSIRHRL